MEIKVGCCGFPVSRKKYYENFKVVEVQETFYKILNENLLRKWREEAPKDFEFAIKAFQGITHDEKSPTWKRSNIDISNLKGKIGFLKNTKEVFEFWEKTLEEAKILKSKIIIIQLPKSFKDTKENIENAYNFFSSIERNINIGVELRGWSEENIKKLCEEYNLIDVTDPLHRLPVFYNETLYFRLHGKYEGSKIIYKYKYSNEDLLKLKEIIGSIKVKEVYVMFNNSYMFYDAKRFLDIL